MSRASVIVPSVAGGPRLERLLGSLETEQQAETIVVDNGSKAQSVTAACRNFGFVEPIRLVENVGFSRAINLAVQQASGEAIVLINDDVVVHPGFVERLAACLGASADVAMVAGVLVSAEDETLIDTAGIEIDASLLAFDYMNGRPVRALEVAADPIGPCAAAAAYDRVAFIDAGGFDEALFAYWEDVDLALRLQIAGGRCALAPRARGTHAHSATLKSGSARKNYLMGFGRGYTLRKWGRATPAGVLRSMPRDLPVAAGQLLLDRTSAGIRGRIDGYRAATPTHDFPAELIRSYPRIGAARTLARRARRKWRRARSTMAER